MLDRTNLRGTIGALCVSCVLVACAGGSLPVWQSTGTPESAALQQTEMSEPKWAGPFPTSNPTDQAAMSIVGSAIAPQRIEAELSLTPVVSEVNGVDTEKFAIVAGDHRYVLGADGGIARWGAVGDHSFAWFYICKPCNNLEFGLYITDLNTGKQSKIASDAVNALGSVLVSEPWIAYVTASQGSPGELHAQNIDTAEDILLDPAFRFSFVQPMTNVALNEGTIAWRADSEGHPVATLRWTSLDTKETRTVVGRDIANSMGLVVSKSLMVWADAYWRVYDARTDATYVLPVLPEGVDAAKSPSMMVKRPVVFEDRVYWSVEVNGVRQDLSVRVGR